MGSEEQRSDGQPDQPQERPSSTRRHALFVIASTVVASIVGSGFLTEGARADAATGDLDISGDSVVTDSGQLKSLEVTLDSGHVSYDGLDTAADAVDVNFFAASSGGDTDASGNRIASRTFTVSEEEELDTNAGSIDVSFSSVDVLAAQDVKKNDFRGTTDGATKETDVQFRLEVVVRDGGGTTLVEAADVATATISVTNEAKSAGAQGSGSTNAGGSNQKP